MKTFPQKLPNGLKLLQGLSDDLVREIYKNHRIDKDGNFIRLIDFEKYKFLEKFLFRKMVSVSEVKTYHEYSGMLLSTKISRIEYTLPNCYELPDRKEQSIDDDKMYLYLYIKEDTVSYTIEKHRLIKIEEFCTKDKPVSMYFRRNFPRGNYRDYDWEVFTIASDASNQDV